MSKLSDDQAVMARVVKQLYRSIEQIQVANNASTPPECKDRFIAHATRDAMVQLNVLRDQFGFESFTCEELRVEIQPGYADLLAAAEQALDRLETLIAARGGVQGDDHRAVENLKAAIAKATEVPNEAQ